MSLRRRAATVGGRYRADLLVGVVPMSGDASLGAPGSVIGQARTDCCGRVRAIRHSGGQCIKVRYRGRPQLLGRAHTDQRVRVTGNTMDPIAPRGCDLIGTIGYQDANARLSILIHLYGRILCKTVNGSTRDLGGAAASSIARMVAQGRGGCDSGGETCETGLIPVLCAEGLQTGCVRV